MQVRSVYQLHINFILTGSQTFVLFNKRGERNKPRKVNLT